MRNPMVQPLKACLVMALALIVMSASAENPPMPPERPAAFRLRAGMPAATPSPSASALVPEKGYCLAMLARLGIEAAPAVQDPNARPQCQIREPVRLSSIRSKARGGGLIRLPDNPLLACAFASAFGEWIGSTAAPLLEARLGSPLAEIRTGPGYDCRTINRSASGKTSAHATGEAIDMDRFTLADGRVFLVGTAGEAADALAAMRRSGCGWFTTVLGPGADPAHASHIHVDVMRHGKSGSYRICQ
jgi:hypothetical protein